MDSRLQVFVALDGFEMAEIDIYERRGRQHNCQSQREHEPGSAVAAPELFPVRLHSDLHRALRHIEENIA
jgi:hypothetical protein